jgi:type II secretory pathway predicted ATPase ExeA
MYLEHFGLRERPFSSAPDPRFIYLGDRHERALAHLRRCVQAGGGLAHLVGPSGIGKTTICRMLLNRLPERVDVALIPNPVPTPQEMLSVVCDELGVAYGTDAPSLILGDSLYRKQAAGLGERKTVVIVDEAQSLSLEVLEQLYMLSGLEIEGQKLLEVILIGEPWLKDLLARVVPHRLSESAGYHLLPLTEAETCGYVRHRMATAGGSRKIFDVDALREVHKLSSGVPRLINAICARALLSAVAQRHRSVDRSTIRAAGRSVLAPAGSPAIEVPVVAPRIEPVTVQRARPRPTAARARRPLWPWLVTGGLVLNAAVIVAVVLAPRPADVVPTRTEARAEADMDKPAGDAPATTLQPPPLAPRPPDIVPTRTEPRAEANTESQAADAPAMTPQPPPVSVIEEPVRSGRPPDALTPAAQPAVTPPPIAPRVQPIAPQAGVAARPAAPVDETPRQRRRRERNELAEPPRPPATNQVVSPQELQIKIDMLVWAAEPRERMVYVNGHKYVEGQTLESGAVLERIEQDGIVVIQGGQRLRLRSEAR